MFAHLNQHSSDVGDICALYSSFLQFYPSRPFWTILGGCTFTIFGRFGHFPGGCIFSPLCPISGMHFSHFGPFWQHLGCIFINLTPFGQCLACNFIILACFGDLRAAFLLVWPVLPNFWPAFLLFCLVLPNFSCAFFLPRFGKFRAAFLVFWPNFAPISGLQSYYFGPFWPISGLHFDDFALFAQHSGRSLVALARFARFPACMPALAKLGLHLYYIGPLCPISGWTIALHAFSKPHVPSQMQVLTAVALTSMGTTPPVGLLRGISFISLRPFYLS